MTETLPTDARGVPIRACYPVPHTLKDDLIVVEHHHRHRIARGHGCVNERMIRLGMLESATRGELYETTSVHAGLPNRHFFTLNHAILARSVAYQVVNVLYGGWALYWGIAPIHVSLGEGPMVTAYDDVICYVTLPVYYTIPGSVVRARADTATLWVPLSPHASPRHWRISEEHLCVQMRGLLDDENVHPITDALYRPDRPLQYRGAPPGVDTKEWYWDVLRACGIENYDMVELMTPEDKLAVRVSHHLWESTGNVFNTFGALFGHTPWTREQTADMIRVARADTHIMLAGQEAEDYARHTKEAVRTDVARCKQAWITADWLEKHSGGMLSSNDCSALVTQGMVMETNILRNAEKMMRRGGRGYTAYDALKKALDNAAR